MGGRDFVPCTVYADNNNPYIFTLSSRQGPSPCLPSLLPVSFIRINCTAYNCVLFICGNGKWRFPLCRNLSLSLIIFSSCFLWRPSQQTRTIFCQQTPFWYPINHMQNTHDTCKRNWSEIRQTFSLMLETVVFPVDTSFPEWRIKCR